MYECTLKIKDSHVYPIENMQNSTNTGNINGQNATKKSKIKSKVIKKRDQIKQIYLKTLKSCVNLNYWLTS